MIIRLWSPIQAAVGKRSSSAMVLFGSGSLALVATGAIRWSPLDALELPATATVSLLASCLACTLNFAGLAACMGAIAAGSMVTALLPHTGAGVPVALTAAAVTIALIPLALAISQRASEMQLCANQVRMATTFATIATTILAAGLWCQGPGVSAGVLFGGLLGILWVPSTAKPVHTVILPSYLDNVPCQPFPAFTAVIAVAAAVSAAAGAFHDWQHGWVYLRRFDPATLVAWAVPVAIVAAYTCRLRSIAATCLAALATLGWFSLIKGSADPRTDALCWALGSVCAMAVIMRRDVLPFDRRAVVLAILTPLGLAWAMHCITGVLPAALFCCGCLALSMHWIPAGRGVNPARAATQGMPPFWRFYTLAKHRFDPIYRRMLHEPEPWGRVLDLGCGPGMIQTTCLQRGDVTAYTGIDLDYDKLLVSRHRLAQTGRRLDHEWRLLNASLPMQRPLPAADTVFLIDVLHYWNPAQQDEILKQAASALPQNGRLYLREGCRSATGSTGSVAWIERLSTWAGFNPAGAGLTFHDRSGMAGMLTKSGFRIEHVDACGDHNLLWRCRRRDETAPTDTAVR